VLPLYQDPHFTFRFADERLIPHSHLEGVGARLLRAARDHATKSGAVRLALSTAVTNTKAQALDERDGWRRDTAFLHYEHELPKGGR
jgi:GNAT superfamily N-acetyltransferase